MKIESWRRQNSARFVYYSYKDSPYYSLLILTLVLSACIVLISNIIIPQVQDWFSIRDESIATRQRIAVIKSNISYMSHLNKNVLEDNRKTVVRALPADKDFSDIINAIAISSVRSGVSVNDFTFGLGPISSSSAEAMKRTDNLDSISITLTLNGSVNRIKTFIKELKEKLPLSEVKSVDAEGASTNITVLFFSKAYRPAKIVEDEPIRPISAQNGAILNTLSSWGAATVPSLEEVPPRSEEIPLF